jgi:hypothetical protein
MSVARHRPHGWRDGDLVAAVGPRFRERLVRCRDELGHRAPVAAQRRHPDRDRRPEDETVQAALDVDRFPFYRVHYDWRCELVEDAEQGRSGTLTRTVTGGKRQATIHESAGRPGPVKACGVRGPECRSREG